MRKSTARVIAATPFLLAAACATGERDDDPHAAEASSGQIATLAIPNPTGDCLPPDRGDRAGYHVVGTEAVWLPDCKNPLTREYYRVFALSTDVAFTMPRIGPEPSFIAEVCGREHALRPVVDRYRLCDVDGPESDSWVRLVNRMQPADAVALTHFLHERLRFTVVQTLWGDRTLTQISPGALPSDVIDACALHPARNSEALQAECAGIRAELTSGSGRGRTYALVAEELTALLNELYGIR